MSWQKTLEELLSRAIGLDPASLGPTLLLRAVHRRMKTIGSPSESEYVGRLQGSDAELRELIEEIVVSETSFFRDHEPFVLLRQHATAWLSAPTGPVFRALSLACATGDEPYSIAIVLMEAGLAREQIEIDAVDISHRALEKARRGVYGSRALHRVEPNLRSRYFRPHPDGMEVIREIRGIIRFSSGNLVRPETLLVRPPYDTIFCRNLLIYLTEEARTRAVETLDRLLGPKGLLFVGHAEQLPLLESRFIRVKWRGSFAYQRRSADAFAPPPTAGFPFSTRSQSPQIPSQTASSPNPLPWASRSSLAHGAFPSSNGPVETPHPAPASTPVFSTPATSSAPQPETAPGPRGAERPARPALGADAADLIAQAKDFADRHQYDEATQLCEQAIRLRGPSAPAFNLLGMIRLSRGDYVQAEQFLIRAVYLDPDDEEALLALSMMARRSGDLKAANNYQRRAERARERKK